MKLFAALLIFCRLSWFAAPASAGYAGYRLFTIDDTKTGTADSTNFTVLISGTWTEFRTTAYNNGKVNNTITCGAESITCPADLIFTSDPVCHTLLSWEIQTYSASTGQVIAWVKVPTLSASVPTLIYACAGNAAITTYQGGSTGAAYDSNTKAVYHFEASTADSSSAGNRRGRCLQRKQLRRSGCVQLDRQQLHHRYVLELRDLGECDGLLGVHDRQQLFHRRSPLHRFGSLERR
jgi:hypothetical protein